MPPRRAKAKAAAPAVVASKAAKKKRPAEDASDSESQKDAPPPKKARQNASKAAGVVPAEVIELSSDEESDAGKPRSPKKAASAPTAVDVSDDSSGDDSEGEDAHNDASEEEAGEDEDGNPRLPRKVRERLEYIETHTDGLTSTYLKFITRELPNYMGKGGSNAHVACDIANHCAFQAQLGRSDLAYERRLVKRVHGMCYGSCGESDNSDDEYDDDYEIPKEILTRLMYCLGMLEGFDVDALRKVIKKLPKYKGRRKGEQDDVLEDVMAHLDDMAAKKADIRTLTLAPLVAPGSQSSDYFEDEDPSFLEALDATVLPGDLPASYESDAEDLAPPPPSQPSLKRRHGEPDPVDEAIYGPSRFGEFGEYMGRKRAKLQIQNSEISATGTKSQIFKGIAVYVNGYTEPSVQELRALLVLHGGIFQPYLDKKSIVTHIVTCVLTEAKMREFKNMKVVVPGWLTESVKAGMLLPWRDFIFAQGAPPRTQVVPATAPSYAADASNLNAQRAMANPEWRSAHTSAAPGFIKGYFEHSRLHFLSTIKAELVQLVREAQTRAEAKNAAQQGDAVVKVGPESPAKGKGRSSEERVIMHCDFDCFFVAAGLLSRPNLRGKPVVVCHSQGTQGGASSTSEIACASYEARKFGIKNGMSLQQARKLCPTIVTMPYEFERYKDLSLKFYTVLMSHADEVEAVSIDEALIDVTAAVSRLRTTPKDFAETIRAEVKEATACEISIGIAHNVLLARLATRRAKPAGALHLVPADVPALIATLDITDLWGFAGSHRDKAREKLGSTALSALATQSRAVLCDALGPKTGERLYNAIRGIDHTELRSDKQRKSVSVEINYGIRFESNEKARDHVFGMAGAVAERLNEVKMLGRQIALKIMKRDPSAPVEPPKFLGHGACDVFNKQMPLDGGRATSDRTVIGDHAWQMLSSFNFDPKELRGIGIHISKLEPVDRPLDTDPKQGKLPFKSSDAPLRPPSINTTRVGPPDTSSVRLSADVSLPDIEEVDQDVLAALPVDVRQELEHEWRRRSESPFPGKGPQPPAPPLQRGNGPPRPHYAAPPGVFPQRQSAKATRMQQSALRLGPRSGAYVIDKNSVHPNRPPNAFLRPTDADLLALDVDPEVYALLPRAVQREQLTRARLLKAGGIPEKSGERLILKPRKYVPPPDLFRQPPPYAKYPERPKLRQQGRKGEKLFFTEADDVQGLIEAWVNAFKDFPPNEKDIEFFAKFLVQSVDSALSTDTGVERAVAIVKWWLVLLRRYWGDYEHSEDGVEEEDARVAMAWWAAFRDVKGRLDLVARKKFGGRLSLR
ncbi:hypothetical protein B0H11DRAFT_2392932 [Mycena galericulata]|nr:hypothetical protein B0H11DRAFT_2392932 [Mycena galericulata]